jgi:membrane protein DedA with SNARE-associated domain
MAEYSFLAGFTPLPYKAFTISSGLIAFNLPVFIIVSLISRSLRFFIVAYLSYKFGELFTEYMEKHGSKMVHHNWNYYSYNIYYYLFYF